MESVNAPLQAVPVSKPWETIAWMNFASKLPRSSRSLLLTSGVPGVKKPDSTSCASGGVSSVPSGRVAQTGRGVRGQAGLELRQLLQPRPVLEYRPKLPGLAAGHR